MKPIGFFQTYLSSRCSGERLQEADRAERLLIRREAALGFLVAHLELGLLLIRRAQVRLEHQIPGVVGVAVIAEAAVLARLRHLHPVRKALELILVAADHQADDLEGALLVEPMLVVEGQHVALLAVAPVHQEPSARRLEQHVVGILGSGAQHGERRVGVGGILLAAEHRKSHLVDQGVADLVGHHEQHVPGHELDEIHLLLRVEPLEAGIRAHLLHGIGHRGPHIPGLGRGRRGRRNACGNEQEQVRRANC